MEKISVIRTLGILFLALLCLTACKKHTWNNPHASDTSQNYRYTSFYAPPKTLDPALSYSTDQAVFIAQIYEPPLQYSYLQRPYALVPLTAAQLPDVSYLDAKGNALPENTPSEKIAFTRYIITLQPNILYQPHPAFAKDAKGNLLYAHLSPAQLKNKHQLSDFSQTGTRELVAEDYVYGIKRLISPKVNSPILSVMDKYIVGLSQDTERLNKIYQQNAGKNQTPYLDLRNFNLTGVKALDRYRYEITIYGKQPTFRYWLAMYFFSPIPWEADQFYSQLGMQQNNISFSWYPVGTGAYMLTKNNPNQEMVLTKNPNFHREFYPNDGSAADQAAGLMANAGKRLPFIDKAIFSLEKEALPRWNKFLQGYYDASGISTDSFDQAITIDANNQPQLTPAMQAQHLHLYTSVDLGIFYWGFNMLDPIVGGNSERARKLRQAIAIALNTEEFITIFLNGRGIAAQSPIPPGVTGYQDGATGIDPYMYRWQNNQAERLPLTVAKQLLAEAGYPNGRDAQTGKALILNYDVPASSAPDDKARFDWMREQFAKLGIGLNIRATQYNRFQEKIRSGDMQIYFWGWVADYPDPENFLFLLYGPNGKVKFGGENATNYSNPDYDKLFVQMQAMPDGPARAKIIKQMIAILQHDQPWIWGFHAKTLLLTQAWNGPIKADAIGYNTLKYLRVDPALRQQQQLRWNTPYFWPLIGLFILAGLLILPVLIRYWRAQHQPQIKRF